MKAFLKISLAFLIGVIIFIMVIEEAGVKSLSLAMSVLFSYKGLIILLISMGAFVVSIYKWKGIIETHKKTSFSFKEISKIWFTGYAADRATPVDFLGGGPVRVFLARKKLDITYGDAISSVIIDKILDVTFFTLFLIGGVFTFLLLGKELSFLYAIYGILILFFLTTILFYFYLRVLRKESIFLWVFMKFSGEKQRNGKNEKLVEEVEYNIKDFFSHRKEVLKAAFLSFSREIFRWMRIFVIILFLVGSYEIEKSIAIYGLSNLSLVLPLPAGIGTLEAVSGYAFSAFGWGFHLGATMAIIWHGIMIFFSLVGLYFGIRFALEIIPEKITILLNKFKNKTK